MTKFSPLLMIALYNPFEKINKVFTLKGLLFKNRVVLSKKEKIECFSVLAQIGRQVLKQKTTALVICVKSRSLRTLRSAG